MLSSPSKKSLIARIVPEDNLRHFFMLLVFGAMMLFIRTFPLHARIFTNWPGEYGNFVNFSADDAIYHMRLVHNTLHHFPFRVFFDPFTHFPYGSHIAFGPLFTLIIAASALIVGLGHPSPELINHVGAYMPPIMAMLCLIPVYFIGRKLFGKTTALLAAFVLTFLPGEFLNRSALGFVDHHVAEALFSTITCAFLIYALDAAKSRETYTNILFHGVFAGITFGLFILIWQGALMFGAIFLIFFVVQLLIDNIKNDNVDYLLLLAGLVYILPAIIILPYVFINPITLYPSNNILILIAMFAVFVACYLLHGALKHKQLMRDLYPLALAILFISIVFILKRFFPQIYVLGYKGFKLLFHPTQGMLTVSEVRPAIIGHDGKLVLQPLWHNLFWAMPLAIIGLGRLGYRSYKNQKPTEVFLFIWTLFIIAATCAQIRFNYYLAINAALLSGYGIYSLLELIDYPIFEKKIYLGIQKFIFYVFFFLLIFIIADPIFMHLMDRSVPAGVQVRREWYDALIWLKTHTPNPQGAVTNKNLDYTFGYYPVPKNLSIPYDYPKGAYGVMSWWDVGHQITYIAERIPNATPFQLGIIEKNGKAGAALFFTSTDEKKAVENLDEVGARYVILTSNMIVQLPGMGVWCNDTKDWRVFTDIKVKYSKKIINLKVPTESSKFLHSMLNRLFYDDANKLEHFRLIYEASGGYNVKIRRALFIKPKLSISMSDIFVKKYKNALELTQKINRIWMNKNKTIFAYSALPPVKVIKIFEKVKGAVIRGEVSKDVANDTEVNLILKLKTKYDRVFTYEQKNQNKRW